MPRAAAGRDMAHSAYLCFCTRTHTRNTHNFSHQPPAHARRSIPRCLQIISRITERGYRNMAGSKNPDASLTGALSREVLFTRLGPATYALAVSAVVR